MEIIAKIFLKIPEVYLSKRRAFIPRISPKMLLK
jgi:hypothetical protein